MPPSSSRIEQFNLQNKQWAERKLLLTVVEWQEGNSTVREIVGTRVEESDIDYNPAVEIVTDVLGVTKTFVQKTQPQQDFDSYPIFGNSKLGEKLNDIRHRNATSELKQFTVYVITAFILTPYGYETEKHINCTIAYNSLGGADKVEFPITIYFSNDIDNGVINKLADDFTFTSYDNIIEMQYLDVYFANQGNLAVNEFAGGTSLPVDFSLVNGNLLVMYDSNTNVSNLNFTVQNGNLFASFNE